MHLRVKFRKFLLLYYCHNDLMQGGRSRNWCGSGVVSFGSLNKIWRLGYISGEDGLRGSPTPRIISCGRLTIAAREWKWQSAGALCMYACTHPRYIYIGEAVKLFCSEAIVMTIRKLAPPIGPRRTVQLLNRDNSVLLFGQRLGRKPPPTTVIQH